MAGDIGEWDLAPFVFEGERRNPRGAQALPLQRDSTDSG